MLHRTSIVTTLVLLGAGLLVGCSVVTGTITTIRALDRAGYHRAQIDSGLDGVFTVSVERESEDPDGSAREAARIVWTELPLRIDHLSVISQNRFGRRGTYTAGRATLETDFGMRSPDLDKGVDRGEVRTLLIGLAVAVVVGLVFLTAIIVTIVLLVRRNRRNRRPPPGYPGHPGYPQPPPGSYPPGS